MIKIDPQVLENCKRILRGNCTSDGIEMLRLPNSSEYNFAGNTYLDSLREIIYLLKLLGEDSVLYK